MSQPNCSNYFIGRDFYLDLPSNDRVGETPSGGWATRLPALPGKKPEKAISVKVRAPNET